MYSRNLQIHSYNLQIHSCNLQIHSRSLQIHLVIYKFTVVKHKKYKNTKIQKYKYNLQK